MSEMNVVETRSGNGRPPTVVGDGDGDGGAHERARELIAAGRFEEAISLLECVEASEREAGRPSDVTHGLLGTTLLLLERYEAAEAHLRKAAELDGDRAEWREKLLKVRATRETAAHVPHPPYEPPNRDAWVGPPGPVEGVLPVPPAARPAPARGERLRRAVRRALGAGATAVFHRASSAAGRWLGTADEVWTNWYRRPLFLGVLVLGYTRNRLNARNLHDVYPKGELTAFQSRGLVAPEGAKYFRTADGSWNNLESPKDGAANVRFMRNINPAVTWPKASQLMTPNPAEISQRLFARGPGGMKPVPFLNLLAAAWIQFNVHDWVSHRTSHRAGYFEIPLPPDHPARQKYHQTKMFVGKTDIDPTRRADERDAPPTYINEVTSWWDASPIYGSDQATADRLRSFRGGELKLDPDGRLPAGPWGFEDTGFNRNWWVGLALLHTLFAREHNAICRHLARRHRDWDDNRLYHTARLINAAVIAKIHTVEWTPAILPNPGLYQAMNANWYGLLETNLRPRAERKVFPWYKISNPELGGIVGNPVDRHGAPFGLSEEFTEIYRLHELLPDQLTIRRFGGPEVEQIGLADVRQAGARKLSDRVSMGELFYSFGNMNPGQLVLHNYPDTLRELTLPGNPLFDLAAVDILRARERGVPRYNEFRRQVGLNPIRRFEDLTPDADTVRELKRLYDNDLEAIDLMVGSRAEAQRPTGYGFGETIFQLFILNASRRLQADRFFTDSYNEETYSAEGLAWIDAADFKSVLLRHFPELGATGLMNVTNAFEPWDSGELDPVRHPLRAFDRLSRPRTGGARPRRPTSGMPRSPPARDAAHRDCRGDVRNRSRQRRNWGASHGGGNATGSKGSDSSAGARPTPIARSFKAPLTARHSAGVGAKSVSHVQRSPSWAITRV
jgi:heme peroxidase